MELKESLKPYCEAVEKGIQSENWILTIMTALTLPDICNSLEGKKGRKVYIDWFNRYVTEYSVTLHSSKALKMATTLEEAEEALNTPSSFDDIIEEKHEYLSGVNVYALRCAFLHNGDGEIGSQKVSLNNSEFTLGINKVKFDSKITNRVIMQYEEIVYINPKVFCEAILEGVEEWINQKQKKRYILNNSKKLQIFE